MNYRINLYILLFSVILPCFLCASPLYTKRQTSIGKALINAAKAGNHQLVKKLLARKAIPNYSDEMGNTSLHFASFYGFWEIMTMLVEAQVDINSANKSNQEYIFAILSNKHGGTSPLMLACLSGNTATVEYLIKNGANVNQQDDNGQVPLTYAIMSYPEWPNKHLTPQQKEIIKLLIDNGANPSIQDIHDLNPLYYYRCVAELVPSLNDSTKLVANPEAANKDPLYQKLKDIVHA